MDISKVEYPNCVSVRIEGEFDRPGNAQLEAVLKAAIDSGQRHIVVDLANATFLSSAGLRVVISAAKRARALPGGDLRLAAPGQRITTVLELAGLLSVLRVFDSEQAAVASFADPVQTLSKADSKPKSTL